MVSPGPLTKSLLMLIANVGKAVAHPCVFFILFVCQFLCKKIQNREKNYCFFYNRSRSLCTVLSHGRRPASLGRFGSAVPGRAHFFQDQSTTFKDCRRLALYGHFVPLASIAQGVVSDLHVDDLYAAMAHTGRMCILSAGACFCPHIEFARAAARHGPKARASGQTSNRAVRV